MPPPRLNPDEVLAIARLRQWAHDRAALRSAKTTDYRRTGWQERRQREADSRLVRVLDFERALSFLPAETQTILMLTYGDGQPQPLVAAVCGVSTRTLFTRLVEARQSLAQILDRLDLL